MALGALSPELLCEPHIPAPRPPPREIGSEVYLGQSEVCLSVVKGRCRLEEGRPQSGEQRRPGGFGGSYFPKNDLHLLSAKQKSISHTNLVKPPNVF